MAYEVQTEILIQSSKEKVWKIFSDFDNYPNWNPFINYIRGAVIPGRKIRVSIMGISFNTKVLVYEPFRELRWKGHLLIPGIFDGEHYFILDEIDNGAVRFRQGEIFSGILVPLCKRILNTKVKQGYEKMNVKLKELVEKN